MSLFIILLNIYWFSGFMLTSLTALASLTVTSYAPTFLWCLVSSVRLQLNINKEGKLRNLDLLPFLVIFVSKTISVFTAHSR